MKPYTKKELETIITMNGMGYAMMAMLKATVDYKASKLYGSFKNGSYGYHLNEFIGQLYYLLRRLDINSVTDLGCGPGILLKVIESQGTINCFGYDFSRDYVTIARALSLKVDLKDILKLKKGDIKSEAIYFWDPFVAYTLSQEFAKVLANITEPGQYVICRAGHMSSALRETNAFKESLEFYCYNIFVKQ